MKKSSVQLTLELVINSPHRSKMSRHSPGAYGGSGGLGGGGVGDGGGGEGAGFTRVSLVTGSTEPIGISVVFVSRDDSMLDTAAAVSALLVAISTSTLVVSSPVCNSRCRRRCPVSSLMLKRMLASETILPRAEASLHL